MKIKTYALKTNCKVLELKNVLGVKSIRNKLIAEL